MANDKEVTASLVQIWYWLAMKDRDFEVVMQDFFKQLENLPYNVYETIWKKLVKPYGLHVKFEKPSDIVSDDIKIALIKRMKIEHEEAHNRQVLDHLLSL